MSERPDTSGAGVVMTEADVAEVGHIRAATPTVDRIAEECGATVRVEKNKFGHDEKVATVPLRVAFEAMRKPWQMDTERQNQLQAKRPLEELRDAGGKTQKVWNIHAEQVAKTKGLKPVWRVGGTPLELGPEGMLWRRWRKSWEPTGRYQVGVLGELVPCIGVQHDPDGQPWVAPNGEWRRATDDETVMYGPAPIRQYNRELVGATIIIH
jgi:hypothetical protein